MEKEENILPEAAHFPEKCSEKEFIAENAAQE